MTHNKSDLDRFQERIILERWEHQSLQVDIALDQLFDGIAVNSDGVCSGYSFIEGTIPGRLGVHSRTVEPCPCRDSAEYSDELRSLMFIAATYNETNIQWQMERLPDMYSPDTDLDHYCFIVPLYDESSGVYWRVYRIEDTVMVDYSSADTFDEAEHIAGNYQIYDGATYIITP